MRTFFGGLPAVALLALQLCPLVLADLTKSSEPAPVLEKREPLDLSTDPYYKPQASLGKRAGSGRDLVKKQCVDPNMVVFSLDDGPYLWHGESAKFFESNGLKASWFINGDNVSRISYRVNQSISYQTSSFSSGTASTSTIPSSRRTLKKVTSSASTRGPTRT